MTLRRHGPTDEIRPAGTEAPPPETQPAASPLRGRWGRGWWSLPATLGGAVLIFLLLGSLHYYSISFILETIRSGIGPLQLSLLLTSLSFLIGFVLAIPLGLIRAFPPAPLLPAALSGPSRDRPRVFRRLARWLRSPPAHRAQPLGRPAAAAAPGPGGRSGLIGIRRFLRGPHLFRRLARWLRSPLAHRAQPPGRPAAAPAPGPGGRSGPLGVRRFLVMLGSWLRYPAYGLASAYVAVIRGTPFLVQLFIIWNAVIFAYPRLDFFGENSNFWAALLALTLNTTGYQAEALRGGFQSVGQGQVEAARAMGLSRYQVFRRIILPQSLRLVTLPLTNEWISNFKTSTIASFIAIYELFSWSRTYISLTLGHPIEAFVMLVIFYLAINVTLSRVVTYVESRRRIPGLGSLPPEFVPRASVVPAVPAA